ncbi:TIR domain-containing protein [bacterium]|nr:TIR domain-containing protein [bacterium]
MARKVFFSFHYKPDNWRASQVRNMGVVEGNKPASDNDWESITGGGSTAIERWINNQMNGTSCSVLLIGENTAGRKWINYEIAKTWNDKKGLVGIYVHNLKDSDGYQSYKGSNPFAALEVNGKNMSSIVKSYSPPYTNSKDVYAYIHDNIADWIEEAIEIRTNF